MRINPLITEEQYARGILRTLQKSKEISDTELTQRASLELVIDGLKKDHPWARVSPQGNVMDLLRVLYRNFVASEYILPRLRKGSPNEMKERAKQLADIDTVSYSGKGNDKRGIAYDDSLFPSTPVLQFYELLTTQSLTPHTVMNWHFSPPSLSQIIKSALKERDRFIPFESISGKKLESLFDEGIITHFTSNDIWTSLRDMYGDKKILVLPPQQAIAYGSLEYRTLEKKTWQSIDLEKSPIVQPPDIATITKTLLQKLQSGEFNGDDAQERTNAFALHHGITPFLYNNNHYAPEHLIPPKVPDTSTAGIHWRVGNTGRRYLLIDAIEGCELYYYLQKMRTETKEAPAIRFSLKSYPNHIRCEVPSRSTDTSHIVGLRHLPLQHFGSPSHDLARKLAPKPECSCPGSSYRAALHDTPMYEEEFFFDAHGIAAELTLSTLSQQSSKFRHDALHGQYILASTSIIPEISLVEVYHVLRYQTIIQKPDTIGKSTKDFRPLNEMEIESLLWAYVYHHRSNPQFSLGTTDLRELAKRDYFIS